MKPNPDDFERSAKEHIVKYLQSGDSQHWGYIFELFKKPVYLRCLKILQDREEARDATSDTFIKAFENIRRFDPKRPFYPWLHRIAVNHCIDLIRRKSLMQFRRTEDHQIENDLEGDMDKNELMNKIARAIEKLSRAQKRCFYLFYIQQRSYRETAEITGYEYNQVRSYIQNGRRRFKQFMNRFN